MAKNIRKSKKKVAKIIHNWIRNKELPVAALILEFIFILIVIYITLDNDLAVLDNKYTQIIEQINSTNEANEQLYYQLLKYESFTFIAQQAKKMGFVPVTSYIYLP